LKAKVDLISDSLLPIGAGKIHENRAVAGYEEHLNLQGCLVTIDAMGCQKKIAASVLHKGADYLLSVKDIQPKLVKAFKRAFPVSELVHFEGDIYVTGAKNRGRQETPCDILKYFTYYLQYLGHYWSGLKTVSVVISFRSESDKSPAKSMTRYYIRSKKLAGAARQHWHIENKLH